MNRLWVRLSVVIGVVICVGLLFPLLMRSLYPPPEHQPLPAIRAWANDEVGQVRIAEIQRAAEQRTWEFVTRSLLIASAVGVGAGILLSRWVTSPLNELERGAMAIAAGKLSHRVSVRGSRELTSVGRSFNRMASELERQEELRHNLLADVTHELRHPVHILQGSLRAILDGVYPLNMEEVAQMLEHTDHLTMLVNDLHELALAEAHELPLHPAPTDLGELARSSIESLLPVFKDQDVGLAASLPPEPVVRSVDAGRLRQALMNLLSNALRFTPAGGTVTLSLSVAESNAEIRVRDTGMGISGEDLSHVFDRFYRGDRSRSREESGTGLGLAIARAIIEAHGGGITAHSAGAGQGAEFVIRLPADEGTALV